MDLFEFETSMVYRAGSRTASKATQRQRNPISVEGGEFKLMLAHRGGLNEKASHRFLDT